MFRAKPLGISALILLNILLATAVVNAWTHGSIAQSILSSLQVTASPPSLGSADNRNAVVINCTTDSSNINPDFSNTGCEQLVNTTTNGNNINAGSGNQAKTTFTPLNIFSLNYAAGQRINAVNEQHCIGSGDCSAWGTKVFYAGGPVNGDEGQAFGLFSPLQQQTNLDTATILSVTRTTCNTTATQAITKNIAAQAITVSSTTGCNVNDWVIIDQQIVSGTYGAEAVQITAVGGGTITGVFTMNHANSTTVTPATVIATSPTSGALGQGRVLVNTSTAATYSTGTVSAINSPSTGAGSQFAGSGTTWANNMVGGNSSNIGCISMTADDYNDGSTYFGATLKSWYQLTQINSTTSLNAFSFTTTGDTSYVGNGPGPDGHGGGGGYIIRPCVQVLRVSSDLRTAIAETTATTWTVGDTVEEAITPYPDVSGFNYSFEKYTPGGITRSFLLARNGGARTMNAGISLDGVMPKGVTGQDYIPWSIGMNCVQCATGIQLTQIIDQAFLLDNAFSQGTVFTGSISGTTITVSAVSQGTLGPGQPIACPTCTAHTFIASGSGGVGTYTVAISGCPGCTQTVASTTMQAGSTDQGGKIAWAGSGAFIMPNTANQGIDIGMLLPGGATLSSKSPTIVGSGSLASLNYQGTIGTTPSTFSALGTCSAGRAGQAVYISDSNASTLNATITASGATQGWALCNGSNWTYH